MKSQIVDIFSHYISRSVGGNLGKFFNDYHPYPVENADPEVRLRIMEKYGVSMQALSLTTPALVGMGAEEAADICRLSNHDSYQLCKAYPDRFVNICIISLLDVRSAIKELERSINELGCRGITLSTNQNGRGLDSPEYFSFYEKVAEHDLPILLHPTYWESYPLVDMEKGWRMMMIFGWPFDTTQAVWRLIFGGVLDRYPSLKVVVHHMGALFPYFARRLEQSFNRFLKDKLPRHISEYWGNIYTDNCDATASAYPCGYAFFGPDRLMYGSDYPFGPESGEGYIRANLSGIDSMDISPQDKAKILGENAKKLLKVG